jgi:hypothetical protein
MSNNIKVLFWLYKAKAKQSGEAPLMLRVTYRNERKQLSTGYYIPISKWDAKKSRLKGKDATAEQVNNYIKATTGKLLKLGSSMVDAFNVDLTLLLQQLQGKDISQATLLELVTYHNNKIKEQLGNSYTFSTSM